MAVETAPHEGVGAQRRRLFAEAMKLQMKLWVEAARDLVLSPIALLAVVLDLVLAGRQTPRHFQRTLDFGRRSDRWIDLWGAERAHGGEVVDGLLDGVVEALRDPEAGVRRARVLRRWVERQAVRARRRVERPAPPG
ncbi:MAG: hypothetical protein DYH17_04155 [Xanthomonadales bacterium PRO6]|nr:hypothetical protein [Xanthomonadales bacterium]MCE7930552.1 hypothetical protein [Xanthomonadales bacterium PRO6]